MSALASLPYTSPVIPASTIDSVRITQAAERGSAWLYLRVPSEHVQALPQSSCRPARPETVVSSGHVSVQPSFAENGLLDVRDAENVPRLVQAADNYLRSDRLRDMMISSTIRSSEVRSFVISLP